MPKQGMRKWRQEKTNLDADIIRDVKYLTRALQNQIIDDGWDLSDVGRFRRIRFELETRFDDIKMEEYDVIVPFPITFDDEYDFELEWKAGSRPFNIVFKWFLRDGRKTYEIDLGDFA